MNPWFRHPRILQAQADSYHAEQAERRANFSEAHMLHLRAAEAYAAVALSVPPDYPNTRSDLAIAGVASYARSGDFGGAIELARRMLAERDALTDDGAAELETLARDYGRLVVAAKSPPVPLTNRGHAVREKVRTQFARVA